MATYLGSPFRARAPIAGPCPPSPARKQPCYLHVAHALLRAASALVPTPGLSMRHPMPRRVSASHARVRASHASRLELDRLFRNTPATEAALNLPTPTGEACFSLPTPLGGACFSLPTPACRRAVFSPPLRIATFLLTLALATLLTGCVLNGKKPAAPATPAAPAPTANPPAPPQPLSIPQTQVEIPPPQPVSPEALAAGQTPPDEPEPAADGGLHDHASRTASMMRSCWASVRSG